MICKACGQEFPVEERGTEVVISSVRIRDDHRVAFQLCDGCTEKIRAQGKVMRSIAEIAQDLIVGAFGDAVDLTPAVTSVTIVNTSSSSVA